MVVRWRSALSLSLFAVLAAGLPAIASPRDARPGDLRAVFARAGTPLRERPSTLGAPLATLAAGAQVRVLAVQSPWLRVQTVPARGQAGQTGWLRAYETVEAKALQRNAAPAHTVSGGGAGVSSREVSAAGRQWDADAARGYRRTRQDLVRAYRLVDRMEADTQASDPLESVAFIAEGHLGRAGRDYARPGRVAGGPAQPSRRARPRASGGLFGKLGGELARRAGAGGRGARIAESLIGGATDYAQQVGTRFTPRQEYLLGRAVAAEAIARYGVDPDEGRRRYVRAVGDAVVRLSSRLPANFGGYHFEVLDSDEINGVSGPGGFVLVTRGAVTACRSEAELAGILAHELAHIRDRHGERVLRQGKQFPGLVRGLSSVAGAAAGAAGAGQWAQGLARFFGQVAGRMSSTAIDHGYGRSLEFAADTEGTNLLFDVYYDHTALRAYLLRMGAGHRHYGAAATHAAPAVRAASLEAAIRRYGAFQPGDETAAARAERFAARLGAPAAPR